MNNNNKNTFNQDLAQNSPMKSIHIPSLDNANLTPIQIQGKKFKDINNTNNQLLNSNQTSQTNQNSETIKDLDKILTFKDQEEEQLFKIQQQQQKQQQYQQKQQMQTEFSLYNADNQSNLFQKQQQQNNQNYQISGSNPYYTNPFTQQNQGQNNSNDGDNKNMIGQTINQQYNFYQQQEEQLQYDLLKGSQLLKNNNSCSTFINMTQNQNKNEQQQDICNNHPNKNAKYKLLKDPNGKFCSKCAISYALKGEQIEELLSDNEKFRKQTTDIFLLKLQRTSEDCKDKIQKLEESNQKTQLFYTKQIEKAHSVFQTLENILKEQKNSVIAQLSFQKQECLNQVQMLQNKAKSQFLDIQKYNFDIAKNYDNIVREMDTGPFTEIIHSYDSKMQEVFKYICEIEGKVMEYHSLDKDQIKTLEQILKQNIITLNKDFKFVIKKGASTNTNQQQEFNKNINNQLQNKGTINHYDINLKTQNNDSSEKKKQMKAQIFKTEPNFDEIEDSEDFQNKLNMFQLLENFDSQNDYYQQNIPVISSQIPMSTLVGGTSIQASNYQQNLKKRKGQHLRVGSSDNASNFLTGQIKKIKEAQQQFIQDEINKEECILLKQKQDLLEKQQQQHKMSKQMGIDIGQENQNNYQLNNNNNYNQIQSKLSLNISPPESTKNIKSSSKISNLFSNNLSPQNFENKIQQQQQQQKLANLQEIKNKNIQQINNNQNIQNNNNENVHPNQMGSQTSQKKRIGGHVKQKSMQIMPSTCTSSIKSVYIPQNFTMNNSKNSTISKNTTNTSKNQLTNSITSSQQQQQYQTSSYQQQQNKNVNTSSQKSQSPSTKGYIQSFNGQNINNNLNSSSSNTNFGSIASKTLVKNIPQVNIDFRSTIGGSKK